MSSNKSSTDDTERRIDNLLPSALLAELWSEDNYDIKDADDWDAIAPSGRYWTGEVNPVALTAGAGPIHLKDDEFAERTGVVGYTATGVFVDVEGRNGDTSGGTMATFDADDARELALALLKAAEEFDRRPNADADGRRQ